MTSRASLGPEYMAERGKFAGPSILEMMENHLDTLVKSGTPLDETKAIGVAEAIAIMRDPYAFLGDKNRSWGRAVNEVWVASDNRLEDPKWQSVRQPGT